LSLIAFHRMLISAGILFCLGFAGWEVRAFTRTSRPGALALAVLFAALGVLLVIYLRRLNRILGYEPEAKD
jgi:hypothetical protein